MQVSPVSNNTNFKAKFVIDGKGILKEAYQNEPITDLTRELLGKLSGIGKGQELEFVSRYKSYVPFYDDSAEIFNRTTGKTIRVSKNIGAKFWDSVLKALIEDESFFKPNKFWQELTGQKVVSWNKK